MKERVNIQHDGQNKVGAYDPEKGNITISGGKKVEAVEDEGKLYSVDKDENDQEVGREVIRFPR